jgi:hypothetical protein
MEGEPMQKFYSKRKHPNDMKYGKRPRGGGLFCPCGNQAGSWKKTKGLGLKEESENKRDLGIMINKEIQLRNEAED